MWIACRGLCRDLLGQTEVTMSLLSSLLPRLEKWLWRDVAIGEQLERLFDRV